MPPRRAVPDQALVELVAAGRSTWRHTALTVAVAAIFRCHRRSARRAIARAVASGAITRTNSVYEAPAEDKRRRGSRTPVRTRTPPQGPRITRRYAVDRHELLTLAATREWGYRDLLAVIGDRFGCDASSARRNIKLAIDYGYIERANGTCVITERAKAQLEAYGRLRGREGARFAHFCSGRPSLALDRLR
jgi:hypothetical protein